MNATSVITIGPSTSSEIDRFTRSVVDAVKNGDESPLKLLVQIRAMEKAFKAIAEQIKDNYMTEADKWPDKKFIFMGNSLEKVDVYTEYDFSVCADTVWETRKSILDMAKSQLSEREAFLKALKEPMTIVDDDGVVSTVCPPQKKSVAGLKVTIK